MQVKFSPVLSDETIWEEGLRLSLSRAMEDERAKMEGEGGQRKRRRRSITAQGTSPLVSSFDSLATPGSGNEADGRKVPPPEKG